MLNHGNNQIKTVVIPILQVFEKNHSYDSAKLTTGMTELRFGGKDVPLLPSVSHLYKLSLKSTY